MSKKMILKRMWALWNFGTLICVEYRRGKCREAANEMTVGGKEEADKMFRRGAFRIGKVIVREV